MIPDNDFHRLMRIEAERIACDQARTKIVNAFMTVLWLFAATLIVIAAAILVQAFCGSAS